MHGKPACDAHVAHETRWRSTALIRRACQLPGHRAARQMFNWTAPGCHRTTRIGGGGVRILEAARGENRRLVNHPRLHVLQWSMHREVPSARANWVIFYAQVDGLVRIQRADFDQRLIDRTHKPGVWFSDQGDRGDTVCHVRRHWVRDTLRCSIRYDIRGDETDHGGALGISAEYQLGVRTVRRHGLDTSARVSNTVYGGSKFHAGGVVDRIYPDRLCAESRAQRVHECLSRRTNTGWLGGAAGEYHLDVGAGLRGSGWEWCAHQRGTRPQHNAKENSDMVCPHGPYADTPRLRGRPERSTCNERRVNAAPVTHQRMMTSGSASEVRRVRSATARSGSPELWSPEDEPESDGLAGAAHGAAANPAPIPRAARHLREAVMSLAGGGRRSAYPLIVGGLTSTTPHSLSGQPSRLLPGEAIW